METTTGDAVAHRIARVNDSPAVTDATLAEQAAQAEQVRRTRAETDLHRQAGGARYERYRFGSWRASTPHQARVKALVEEYAQTIPHRLKAREGLVLYGPVGTGKDHLLFAAMRQAILQHGVSVGWQNCQDLFGEIRDRMDSEKPEWQLISRLEAPAIVVLTDLVPPIGALTAHQSTMLYRIVENRYAAGRVTCAALNVKSDEEADATIGEPTWDRLCDGAWKAFCNWESHRKPARELK